MKKVRVEEAVGMTLCHDITAMRDGFKGAAFKKGHIITQEDIPELLKIGKEHIFIWEDTAGEIHEDDCARMMADMWPVEGAHYEGPSEGKMVLRCDQEGMFRINTELLRAVNSVGDITVSTMPDHYPVKPGDRLASMRIVPLVTKITQMNEVRRLCAAKTMMELLPYRFLKIGVVITGSEVYHGRIKDKFEPVVRAKMTKYPSEILGVTICDDNADMIKNAAESYLDQGADLLICTGGMSVDPDDITPTAIRELGADIISHGVPAQPGNMTLLAYIGDVTVLGVPGAAISLPTTIFDVMLPQIFAGVKFTKKDLINLAEGGLCQQCKPCHFPNCTFGRY